MSSSFLISHLNVNQHLYEEKLFSSDSDESMCLTQGSSPIPAIENKPNLGFGNRFRELTQTDVNPAIPMFFDAVSNHLASENKGLSLAEKDLNISACLVEPDIASFENTSLFTPNARLLTTPKKTISTATPSTPLQTTVRKISAETPSSAAKRLRLDFNGSEPVAPYLSDFLTFNLDRFDSSIDYTPVFSTPEKVKSCASDKISFETPKPSSTVSLSDLSNRELLTLSPSDASFLRPIRSQTMPGRPVKVRLTTRLQNQENIENIKGILNAFSKISKYNGNPKLFITINAVQLEILPFAEGYNHKVWKFAAGTIIMNSPKGERYSLIATETLLKRPYLNPKLSESERGHASHAKISLEDTKAHQYYLQKEELLNSLGLHLAEVYCQPELENEAEANSLVQFIPNNVSLCEEENKCVFAELNANQQTALQMAKDIFDHSIFSRSVLVHDFYPRNIKQDHQGKCYLIDYAVLEFFGSEYNELISILPSLLIAWANGNKNIYTWFMQNWPEDVKLSVQAEVDKEMAKLGQFPSVTLLVQYEKRQKEMAAENLLI